MLDARGPASALGRLPRRVPSALSLHTAGPAAATMVTSVLRVNPEWEGKPRGLRPSAEPCGVARPLHVGLESPAGRQAGWTQILRPRWPRWRLWDPALALGRKRPFRPGPGRAPGELLRFGGRAATTRGPQRPSARPPPSVSSIHLPPGLACTGSGSSWLAAGRWRGMMAMGERAEKFTLPPPRAQPSLGCTLLSITAPCAGATSELVGGSRAKALKDDFFSLTRTAATALFSYRIFFFLSS